MPVIKFDTILVPVDFSSYATEALLYAATLARRFTSQLIVLHVIAKEFETVSVHQSAGRRGLPPHVMGPLTEALDVPDETTEAIAIDFHQQAMTALQHFLPVELRGLRVERRVAIGHPFEQIVDIAKDESVDLIVMGTHGRTGLTHLMLGSVAERVVRLAPCPVLTVKGVPV